MHTCIGLKIWELSYTQLDMFCEFLMWMCVNENLFLNCYELKWNETLSLEAMSNFNFLFEIKCEFRNWGRLCNSHLCLTLQGDMGDPGLPGPKGEHGLLGPAGVQVGWHTATRSGALSYLLALVSISPRLFCYWGDDLFIPPPPPITTEPWRNRHPCLLVM